MTDSLLHPAPPRSLRRQAAELAAPLPLLMMRAERLAASVLPGAHGRRRSGVGDEFWQYRPAVAGDGARMIDWRRSARSDQHFIRQKEWQASQSVTIWVDRAQSMQFSSQANLPLKGDRARILALAASILMIRAGERVGLAQSDHPPRSGETQLLHLSEDLATPAGSEEFGRPNSHGLRANSSALFISDFLGSLDALETAMGKAADLGVHGQLLQVLDPQEEAFPFDGRTIFESIGGSLRHETQKARDLRDRYLERLAERKAALADLARLSGWQFMCHHTGDAPETALLWIHQAQDRGR